MPFKEIEVERAAIKMNTKLGAGMFGEVWKGRTNNDLCFNCGAEIQQLNWAEPKIFLLEPTLPC